ncbi:Pkinase-domain-containing protein [Byssothecium circinans]|uniref:non-specific serine/threonine protein kinase n=1 Tax=Byssothecium circinans TaxID=147558 RepID=A0A6A5TVC4_9PLEO|nr:Pkinase-domain-containing protein [Byssothecium circinans]
MAANADDQAQTVRFSDVNEEIEPEKSLQHIASLAGVGGDEQEPLKPDAVENLRELSKTLQNARCQARYEPVSLPPSRAPSPSSTPTSRTPSDHSSHRHSSGARPSPTISAMHSPPLTPAGTSSYDGKPGVAEQRRDPAMVTPQISPPHEPPPTSMDAISGGDRRHQSLIVPRSPRSSPQSTSRPASVSNMSGVVGPHPKHPVSFAVGPTGDSLPASRDVSPSGSAGTPTPGQDSSATSTPANSRPYTPQENKHDPYSRSKRPPQPRNIDALDARFVFGKDGRKNKQASPSSSSFNLPCSKANDSAQDKRSSFFGGSKNNRPTTAEDSDARSTIGKQQHHGSMSELKRFFKMGGHKHKDKDKEKEKKKSKRAESPAPSIREKIKSKKMTPMTPPLTGGGASVPFADDHGLESRYGKFGKMLGSGAGGSVRLMKRSSDGVTFAVKQFRARHTYESEREYNKKVTAEFCIGSTLHHGNIIETMDLVSEKGNYYVVMEYAPFDLFAIVMTGKMGREEMACCTLQILNGVTYLHNMGLAHRDLKLDNVVVNEHGIMKIIDFGSAAVFKYPFENGIVLASGIVGSDPYLAPEVYDLSKYDPQPTDIWSLAIIFCCMTLRRFPWKAPRVSDNSYKLFVAPPNDGPKTITNSSKSATDLHPEAARDDRHQSGPQSEPASRMPSGASSTSPHHHHHHHHKTGSHSDPVTNDDQSQPFASSSRGKESTHPQVIQGPWRLLRLLPRESRHIIGRMLEVDPKKRATLQEILDDKWVKNNSVCSQEEGGRVLRAPNHEHTLEPGSGSASAPATQQKK